MRRIRSGVIEAVASVGVLCVVIIFFVVVIRVMANVISAIWSGQIW